jgi:lysylphosphatidylglycerol synthetase-like protein (DUF2156 family)
LTTLRRLGPLARALLTFVAVADGGLSLELWALRHHTARWAVRAVLDVVAPVRPLAAVALAAAALYLATRPKRAFRRILLALAAGAGVLSVAAGQPVLILAVLLVGLAALLAGSLWAEQADPGASRRGWSLLGVAGLAALAGAGLLLRQQHDKHVAPLFILPLALAFVSGVVALALLDRNPPLPATRDGAEALRRYRHHARSGVAPFALMRDKRHIWTADRRSVLALGCRVGVALALGPAIGPPEGVARLHREFRGLCLARGWRPAFYQVSEETAAELPGTRQLLIGSEAVVDLDAFCLEGRAMANLRHQVTKARRLGVSVEVLSEASVSWESLAAMRRLAADVSERSRLGEMSFSVGHRDDPAQVERTVGLAFDGAHRLVAYVTWLWLPAAGTVVLDEVKRSLGMPSGALELVIATSLRELRGRARRASLGLAPITGVHQSARLAAAEGFLRSVLGLSSVSPGLYAFKAKFNPGWEPRYLVVERLADVVPVLLAAFLLHYPGALRRCWGWGRAALPRPQ